MNASFDQFEKPWAHPSGEQVPAFAAEKVPEHLAIVMDGNGRWANQRGFPRTHGHQAGEAALLDVVAGAIEAGVKVLSVYAFSTENWKRSPDEVRFLMGFSRDVLRRQRDQLNAWGVRILWSGQSKRLWKSVIKELEIAQNMTQDNTGLTLVMCVNYGGRAEIASATYALIEEAITQGKKPSKVTEAMIQKHLYQPHLPDVDLFIRTSGEQRISNFLLWESAYAEFLFLDTLWPDVDRRTIWHAIDQYINRDRRYGGAQDQPTQFLALTEHT